MSLIEKLRKPKIFDMALFDWVMTILLTLYISYKINNNKYDNVIFIKSLIIMIIFAVSIHYIFDIDTKFNYYLGLNDNPKR
jgi:hypothetical protein